MVSNTVFETHNKTLIVYLSGEIDHSNSSAYKQAIMNQIEQNNCRSLILDFERVRFIDSSGIGLILGRYNQMKGLNGVLAISGASNQLYMLLKISGVNSIIRCYATVKEAIKEIEKYESYRAKV